jgi:dolichol-phosphate mannosyltransferase
LKVAVVVPTYNERENVGPLVEAVKRLGIPDLSMLFVDDSSPDGTSEMISEISSKEPWVHLHKRAMKTGLGAAYFDGLKQAVASLDPDVVVVMDADMQHPPATIKALLKGIEGGADLAIGSRYTRGGGIIGWNVRRRMVSLGANLLVRVLIEVPVRDCTSGYRAFRRTAVDYLLRAGLPSRGFEFNVFSIKIVSRKMKVVEVPFTFSPRKFGKSKLKLRNMVDFLVAVVKVWTQTAVAPVRGY